MFCGRKFGSLEGVRGHMRDKGHAKIRFEPPEVFKASVAAARGLTPEEIEDMNYVPEYSEFYDFSENSQALVDAAAFETFDKGGLELVLKSGKQLGHRSYRRYRQKFRNDYVAKGSKSDERRAGAVAVATRVARKRRSESTTRSQSGPCASRRLGRPRRWRRSTAPRRSSPITRLGARSCTTGARAGAGATTTRRGASSFRRAFASRGSSRDTRSRAPRCRLRGFRRLGTRRTEARRPSRCSGRELARVSHAILLSLSHTALSAPKLRSQSKPSRETREISFRQ